MTKGAWFIKGVRFRRGCGLQWGCVPPVERSQHALLQRHTSKEPEGGAKRGGAKSRQQRMAEALQEGGGARLGKGAGSERDIGSHWDPQRPRETHSAP